MCNDRSYENKHAYGYVLESIRIPVLLIHKDVSPHLPSPDTSLKNVEYLREQSIQCNLLSKDLG